MFSVWKRALAPLGKTYKLFENSSKPQIEDFSIGHGASLRGNGFEGAILPKEISENPRIKSA